MTDTAAATVEHRLDETVASLSLDDVKFHPKYNVAVDGVVLISSDGVAFRVEDFYLKASREMLSLPTKGGPIGLPETSVQIRMVLDKMTDSTEGYNSVPDIVGALGLARRFQFTSIGLLFRQALLEINRDGPAILAYACRSRPIDRALAKSALSLFTDLMPMDREVFRRPPSCRKSEYASPALDNLETAFLESLGVIGAVAYSLALDECQAKSEYHWKSWDWSSVPEQFLENLDRLEK
ncbi:hypothetical protein QFC20_004757 [Naganishia adeliensis]|uniref:Uncharacterized protein n=1 Tax=Naganishia adeliensis TaxID=92952 RepID=A0ACC2VYA4_9TREE|nr:hypothetical protein QFC20_004757 [Naganishia adeliensis]